MLTMEEIPNIINNIEVQKNENNELELGLKNIEVARLLCELNKKIDELCHSNEDNYMMELLAEITEYAIDKEYIDYENLYKYTEEKVFKILNSIDDNGLQLMLNLFKSVSLDQITQKDLPKIKRRLINPLVNGKRYL
jgi:hypothetical protein